MLRPRICYVNKVVFLLCHPIYRHATFQAELILAYNIDVVCFQTFGLMHCAETYSTLAIVAKNGLYAVYNLLRGSQTFRKYIYRIQLVFICTILL